MAPSQNAFDWEDTHLHDFRQPVGAPLAGAPALPPLANHGPSDVAAYTKAMVDVEQLPPAHVRTFRAVVGTKEGPGENLLLSPAAGPGTPPEACLVYVEHSHPHAKGEGDSAEERTPEFATGPTLVYHTDFARLHTHLAKTPTGSTLVCHLSPALHLQSPTESPPATQVMLVTRVKRQDPTTVNLGVGAPVPVPVPVPGVHPRWWRSVHSWWGTC